MVFSRYVQIQQKQAAGPKYHQVAQVFILFNILQICNVFSVDFQTLR